MNRYYVCIHTPILDIAEVSIEPKFPTIDRGLLFISTGSKQIGLSARSRAGNTDPETMRKHTQQPSIAVNRFHKP